MSIERDFAVILIDPQNGCWSRWYSILQSFDHIVQFLHSIANPQSTPILISETGFEGHDQHIFEPIANELSQHGNLIQISRCGLVLNN